MKLIENPAWSPEMIAKARAGKITPACHDKTPYLAVQCDCGYLMHVHRSQIEPIPKGAMVVSLCHQCGSPLELLRDDVLAAMNEAWGL